MIKVPVRYIGLNHLKKGDEMRSEKQYLVPSDQNDAV